MKRSCGCRADPIVFGHTECASGPPWVILRILWSEDSGGRVIRRFR